VRAVKAVESGPPRRRRERHVRPRSRPTGSAAPTLLSKVKTGVSLFCAHDGGSFLFTRHHPGRSVGEQQQHGLRGALDSPVDQIHFGLRGALRTCPTTLPLPIRPSDADPQAHEVLCNPIARNDRVEPFCPADEPFELETERLPGEKVQGVANHQEL